MFTSDASSTNPASRLYLVSVGIGDPDQITLRAQRTIERADVIFGMQKVRDNFAHLIQGKPQYDAGHGLFTLALRGAAPAEVETREREVREIIRTPSAPHRSSPSSTTATRRSSARRPAI